MEFVSIIGKVTTGSGLQDSLYQAGICASGRMNEAISGKCTAVIPSLLMTVLQKHMTDSYPEYISDIPFEIKKLRDKNT